MKIKVAGRREKNRKKRTRRERIEGQVATMSQDTIRTLVVKPWKLCTDATMENNKGFRREKMKEILYVLFSY